MEIVLGITDEVDLLPSVFSLGGSPLIKLTLALIALGLGGKCSEASGSFIFVSER